MNYFYQQNNILDFSQNESHIEFKFETEEEAQAYDKSNIGICITQSKTGYAYIIKSKVDIN